MKPGGCLRSETGFYGAKRWSQLQRAFKDSFFKKMRRRVVTHCLLNTCSCSTSGWAPKNRSPPKKGQLVGRRYLGQQGRHQSCTEGEQKENTKVVQNPPGLLDSVGVNKRVESRRAFNLLVAIFRMSA